MKPHLFLCRCTAATCLALGLTSCVAPEGGTPPPPELAAGTWVEVQGRMVDGRPLVEEVEAIERKDSDTSDKLEITAPAEPPVERDTIRVLGTDVQINEKTDYEDGDGEQVEPYPIEIDDWFRVKTRIRSSGALRAREIRPVDTRRFEIEGEIRELDPGRGMLRVGTISLPLPQDARISLAPEEIYAGSDPLRLFQADERKSVPFTIRPLDDFAIGGQVSFAVEHERDRDLNSARERDETAYDVEGKIDLLWTFDAAGSFALLEGRASHKWTDRKNREDEEQARESLSRAYVYAKLSEALRVQVGRHDFDEEREWLYDEVLDGARLIGLVGDFQLEVAGAVGREFAEVEGNPTEDTATFVAVARYFLNEDHWLTAYALARTDSSPDDFQPQLYGVRSYSRPYKGLGHWAELSWARGDDGDRRIDGHAFDVGLLYRFDAPLRPTVAVGYAYGLGRDAADDRVGYRQSGLQDNNSKFGGVTSFKYYGEVFEPELANLDITTVGIGIRPWSALSFDVVYHGYRQDFVSDTLFPNDLRARPNGRSADLGWEADLIVGYRYARRVTAELIAGRFEPGNAFDQQDPAYRFEAQVRLKF